MVICRKSIILNQKEFDVIRTNYFSDDLSVVRTHYYDDIDFGMRDIRLYFLIVENNEDCRAVVREHQHYWKDYYVENSINLKNITDQYIFSKIGLVKQGIMTSFRYKFCPMTGIELYLDQNAYLGKCDFELVIEYIPSMETTVNIMICLIASMLHINKIAISADSFIKRSKQLSDKDMRFYCRKVVMP